MSAVKPFKLTYRSSIAKETVVVIFKCLDCGCDKVYRPKRQYKNTHLEGFYHCLNCKKQVVYYSYDFISKYIKDQIQLSLF